MNRCVECGKEYDAKRSTSKYCSPKCRHESYLNRTSNAKPISNANAKNITLSNNANFEACRYCGQALPRLSRPRQYPGACYPCAIAQPSKPRDNILSSKPTLHTTHKLTVMERLFYRSGQHNFVSLPGRACYGVYK